MIATLCCDVNSVKTMTSVINMFAFLFLTIHPISVYNDHSDYLCSGFNTPRSKVLTTKKQLRIFSVVADGTEVLHLFVQRAAPVCDFDAGANQR
jgi:hypothetical protein